MEIVITGAILPDQERIHHYKGYKTQLRSGHDTKDGISKHIEPQNFKRKSGKIVPVIKIPIQLIESLTG